MPVGTQIITGIECEGHIVMVAMTVVDCSDFFVELLDNCRFLNWCHPFIGRLHNVLDAIYCCSSHLRHRVFHYCQVLRLYLRLCWCSNRRLFLRLCDKNWCFILLCLYFLFSRWNRRFLRF